MDACKSLGTSTWVFYKLHMTSAESKNTTQRKRVGGSAGFGNGRSAGEDVSPRSETNG